MLVSEIKNVIQSSNKKEFRKFSYTMGIFLILAGFFLFWKDFEWYIYIISTGLILLLSGLFIPIILRPLYIVWMSFAAILGYIMTRIILTVIFCLLFIPVGTILRILRKDVLKESFDLNVESYWIKRSDDKFDPVSAERQF